MTPVQPPKAGRPMIDRVAAALGCKPALRLEQKRPDWAMLLGLALLSSLLTPPRASAQVVPLEPLTLHAGFTRSSFRNVNADDATAAFRVFAQTVARKRGYQMDTDVRLFESPEACEAEIRKGGINMAILDTWDYLGMDIGQVMDPEYVHVEQGSIYKQYLLLTRRGGGATNLAELRGKPLTMLEGKGGNLSRAWLDRLLLTQHLGSKETFFGRLETVAKPSAAVLPVFFGTKPVCLVDRDGFQIMSELNPQVGKGLVITAVSDSYVESVTCISKSGWTSPRAREAIMQAMAELHLEPNGRQILELFKLDQLVPFKEEYLDSARKLRNSCEPMDKLHLAISPGIEPVSKP